MSYCRWSSNHWECDVYVYADVGGGWTTHVAGRRRQARLPNAIKAMYHSRSELETEEWVERYMAAHQAEQAFWDSLPCDEITVNYLQPDGTTKPGIMRTLKDSEYEDLPEPEAGKTYNDPTPQACADRLEALRAKGFTVPQYAIDALRAEHLEETTAESEEASR